MTVMKVPKTEHGKARVFAIDLPEPEAEAFGTPEGIASALGVASLPEGQYEYFPADRLEALGLSAYLVDGIGMDPEEIRPDAARLDALSGHVLIVLSAAVAGKTVTPRAPLRWIGTYGEPRRIAPMEKLRSAGAEGHVDAARPAPSKAAMSGRIASLALLVMFALVFVMILVAG